MSVGRHITAEARLIERLGPALFRAELANGHRLLARVPARAQGGPVKPEPGDRVALQVSPADLSVGRIVG